MDAMLKKKGDTVTVVVCGQVVGDAEVTVVPAGPDLPLYRAKFQDGTEFSFWGNTGTVSPLFSLGMKVEARWKTS